MAAKSNLTNMALSLTLVCLVCSALLGGIYALTAAPIEQAQQAKTNSSIARVLPAFDSVPELETIEVDGASYTYYRVPGSGYAVISKVGCAIRWCSRIARRRALVQSARPTLLLSTSSRAGILPPGALPSPKTGERLTPSPHRPSLPALIPQRLPMLTMFI